LKEYLERVVFYKKRDFAHEEFKKFMFAQSKPFPEMIELICQLKVRYKLKIAVVSNEGRELNENRIKKFQLGKFVDFFITSCYVHFRKPDKDIYRIALDIAQVPKEEILYIEDRDLFVQVAESLGIRGLHHVNYQTTLSKLNQILKKQS
jgi:putative hydrolase of the HAD superfamily